MTAAFSSSEPSQADAKSASFEPDIKSFSGCLIGQCLGDALGFIVEGHPPSSCHAYLEAIKNDGPQHHKRGRYSFGQYSDDSQLARELMISFLECEGFNPEHYARRIAAIFSEGRIVGRGLATDAAAKRLAHGIPWQEAGTPAPSAGNGTAMRAAPVGLFFFDRREQRIQVAHDQGRTTHQDSRCSAGAIAIAEAVALCLRREPLSVSNFTSQLATAAEPFDRVLAEALLRMPRWLSDPTEQAALQIARVGVPLDFHDEWQIISPFVTSSVLWSIYAFLRFPDDYMQAVYTAISAGGDVDTTAAMTGAISGARLGLDAIPYALAHLLNDDGTWGYDELVRLSEKCHSFVMQQRSMV